MSSSDSALLVSNPKMVSCIMAKKDFQNLRKDFKEQGFNVVKIPDGYECHHNNGMLLLRAMNGSRGYLVRHIEGLFTIE